MGECAASVHAVQGMGGVNGTFDSVFSLVSVECEVSGVDRVHV